MQKIILNKEQLELLPLVKLYRREFYLVGGTAIALHIGHRRSIDFDLFKYNELRHTGILKKIDSLKKRYKVTRRVTEQLNLTCNDVKFTFYQYPFVINPTIDFEGYIKMPDLLTLASMKAYALGRRSKWKDYVDLYFILRDYYSISQISIKATEIFKELFIEKQFRNQLTYFDDIDYSESVEYLISSPDDLEIKAFLINKATEIF